MPFSMQPSSDIKQATTQKLTGKRLNVVSRQRIHHLGVDSDPIISERVESIRYFNEWQQRLTVGIVIFAKRIRSSINIEWIRRSHSSGVDGDIFFSLVG